MVKKNEIKNFFWIVLAGLSVFGFSQAQASLILEPYAGYIVSGTADPGTGTTYSFTGLSYGGRVGFGMGEFSLGVDGWAHLTTPNTPSVASSFTYSSAGYGVGPYVGFSLMGVPIHFTLTYLIMRTEQIVAKNSAGSKVSDITQYGSDFKLGVYYSFAHIIFLGAEYMSGSYSKYDDNISGTSGSSFATGPKETAINVVLGGTF